MVKIDLNDPQARAAVKEEKMNVYRDYMNWLEKHPMPQTKKYFIRYDTHKKFILKEIQRREGPIEIVAAKPKKPANMTTFYLVVALVVLWTIYNAFSRMK